MAKKEKSIRYIIMAASVVVAMIAFYAFAVMRQSQTRMRAERSAGAIAVLPLKGTPHSVELLPGLLFKVDTGSDLSTITPEALRMLDSLKMEMDSSFYPVMGRDGDGKYRLETKRYTVTLPMLDYKVERDSCGTVARASWSSLNKLHGVDFAPSRTGQNVLGIDFFEKFKCELRYMDFTVALYFEMPSGYARCTDLEYSRDALLGLWLGKRYYMPINMMGEKRLYFVDTGLRRAIIKRPPLEQEEIGPEMQLDTVESAIGRFPALVRNGVLIQIGNRAGSATYFNYDGREEHYSFNPLNLFTQDVVFDFQGESVYLRPYYNKPAVRPEPVQRVVVE